MAASKIDPLAFAFVLFFFFFRSPFSYFLSAVPLALAPRRIERRALSRALVPSRTPRYTDVWRYCWSIKSYGIDKPLAGDDDDSAVIAGRATDEACRFVAETKYATIRLEHSSSG